MPATFSTSAPAAADPPIRVITAATAFVVKVLAASTAEFTPNAI